MPINQTTQAVRRPAAQRLAAPRPATPKAPVAGPAIARDARASGGVETSGALGSPQAFQGKVIALIATARSAQRDLAKAQAAQPASKEAIALAVQALDAAQADLGVLKLLGARMGSAWSKEGFDQQAFWEKQLAAAPELMIVDGMKGGTAPNFKDKDTYKNFAIRLVGQARAAAADLKALQASGKASPAALESAQLAVRAAEAELVLMKTEGEKNSFTWRFKGLNVDKFWAEQAANVPAGVDLNKTQLADQVRVNGMTLKPDVVVKLWAGQDYDRAIAGNNADNLVFKTAKGDTYVATAVDLGMGKDPAIELGDQVTFRGEAAEVLAVTTPTNSKSRAREESNRAGQESVKKSLNTKNFLPFVGLMTLSVVLLASQGGSIITGVGLKIGLGFAGVFFGGLIALCAVAAMANHFRWFKDISLYKTQAHGDPQFFAPPVAQR